MLWITLAEDQFGPGEREAARKLWTILYYPTDKLGPTAYSVQQYYQDAALMDALENGAFRPSTLELLGQLKADLILRGWLAEDEDGALSVVLHYGEDEPDGAVYGGAGWQIVSANLATGAEPLG